MTKIALSKDSPVGKYSISLKSKLNLNNFKLSRGADDLRRKKYVQNVQKIYYKFKPNHEKQQNPKIIKSQRSSYKFSKLPLEEINNTVTLKPNKNKQPI